MAKVTFSGFEGIEGKLAKLGRPMIQRIVDAGANAAASLMSENTLAARHGPPGVSGRATGEMLQSIGAAEYRETLGGGSREVYPLGDDSRGTRNATKAFVLDHGRGRGLRGDHFITGAKTATEERVKQAMAAEASAAFHEIEGGN